MRGPNFFLVGAAKSGTTALYHALRAHDDVYLPALKEPHVYAYLADPGTARHLYADEAAARRRYDELYGDVVDETAVGDASTTNLVVPGAAAAIARDVPSARIVVILRHPVDRAFSHYCHFVVAGGESLTDFAEAVRAQDPRRAAGFPFTYQYLGWSRYSEQLKPFFALFGHDRVLVHLYDDFCADAEAVVRATLRFLAVDDRGAIPPVGRHNEVRAPPPATRHPRARRHRAVLRPLLTRVRRGGLLRDPGATASRPRPSLDPSLRAELTQGFGDEISQLEDLLGRDLSSWRR